MAAAARALHRRRRAVDPAHERRRRRGRGRAARGWSFGFARSVAASEGGEAEPFVAPVIKSWTWWQNGGFELSIGHHIDGLSVMAAVPRRLHLAARAGLLARVRARRPPLHPLLRRHHAVLGGHARDGPGREHGPADPRLGDHGPLLVPAHRPLVGGGAQRPGRAQGVLHRPRRRRRPARRHVDPVLRRQLVVAGATSARAASASRASPAGRCPARAATACSSGPASPCSSPASARAASSRCTPGCPTRWPARRRCRRCCTPRRWSSPACSSSPACTRCSGRRSRSPTSASTSSS